jgi:S-adenosylmethionine:tRNA ribosyltransferase-isomerase
MRVDELQYQLPVCLIAQRPLPERDASRLLVLDRRFATCEDRQFAELPHLLRGDELIVFNNARVLPARLFGRRTGVHAQGPSRKTAREHLTGKVEVFLTRHLQGNTWEALVRPGQKMRVGERVIFGEGELVAEIVARGELGLRTMQFQSKNAETVDAHVQRLGHVPLPPYIDRPDEMSDRERYQTVFAQRPVAVAAPTAGLHFSQRILDRLLERGCETCEIVLHVGLGTFQPIHTETLEEHKMHAECYEIPEDAAEKIIRAREKQRPILAVGTTVVRALEDAALRAADLGNPGKLLAGSGETHLLIIPGHQFRVVDMLLTNFHLPKSTLLALVAAFAGRESVLSAYRHAVRVGYRFYSYGDCMLIR